MLTFAYQNILIGFIFALFSKSPKRNSFSPCRAHFHQKPRDFAPIYNKIAQFTPILSQNISQ